MGTLTERGLLACSGPASTALGIGLRTSVFLVGALSGALLVHSLRTSIEASKTRGQRTSMVSARALRIVSQEWRTENSECPTAQTLVQAQYVDAAAKLTDAWGGAYVISCEEDDVVVRSPGPDRQLGTADDVVTS